MRREPEIDVLEVSLEADRFSPTPVKAHTRSGGIAIAGVCLAIISGLQLIPGGEPRNSATTMGSVPSSVTPTVLVEAQEVPAEFQWVEVRGLERFESVTQPVRTADGYLAVANPWGATRAASVVVSDDGGQWNRWGSIHGIGGDTEIRDLRQFAGKYLAVGFYTTSMPKTEFAIHERIPAVWTSEDAISWEMEDGDAENSLDLMNTDSTIWLQSVSTDQLIGTTIDQVWHIDLSGLNSDGHLEFFGTFDKGLAMLRTTTTSSVAIREPGVVGDSFASRVDSRSQTLLITLDQAVWKSEVVPFDAIRFNGGVEGAVLVRTVSAGEPDQAAYWMITP